MKLDLKEWVNKITRQAEFRTLLWTNSSPTDAYASGNPVSAVIGDEYDAVEVQFMLWTGYQYVCCTDRVDKGNFYITTAVASSNNYATGSRICPLARSWSFTSASGVMIYGGVQANFGSGETYQTANGVLIPYKIYGIKYVGGS